MLNEFLQILVPGVSIMILVEEVVRSGFRALLIRRKAGLAVRAPGIKKQRRGRLVAAVLTGAGSAWGLAVLGAPIEPAVAVLLVASFLQQALIARSGGNGLAGTLAFFDVLKNEIVRGSDLFAGLAVAMPSLTDPPAHRAVKALLVRFSARQGLSQCLEPLAKAGGLFAVLAADVQRTGWENSAALRLSVVQISERAADSWRRQSRLRLLTGSLERRRESLHHFVMGAAAGYLLFMSGEGLPAWYWFNAAAMAAGLRLPGLLRRPAAFALAIGVTGLLLTTSPARPSLPETASAGETFTPHAAWRARNLNEEWSALLAVSAQKAPECRVLTGFNPGWARVRELPAVSARTTGYVVEGTLLLVLAEHDGGLQGGEWRLVRMPSGEEGWMYSELCIGGADEQD